VGVGDFRDILLPGLLWAAPWAWSAHQVRTIEVFLLIFFFCTFVFSTQPSPPPSFVRSVQMDGFKDEQLKRMEVRGNLFFCL